MLPDIHFIGGPTASGKTAKALALAGQQPSMVINADSMQVYKGLPLLTAQPTDAEKAECPHRLFEVLDPSERCSAGRWVDMAEAALDEAAAAGLTPILVGGTGLYFRALEDGLAEIPDIPQEVRDQAAVLYDEIGHDAFRAKLAEADPVSAQKIEKNDRQRLLRAYEVVTHTGKALGAWHKQPQPLCAASDRDDPTFCHDVFGKQEKNGEAVVRIPDQHGDSRRLSGMTKGLKNRFTIHRHVLMPERKDLYARCDARFLQMVEMGALDEVRAVLAQDLDPSLPAMKILGVRELSAHLRGESSLDEAIAKAQQVTRNYAKRQMTWFRNQWPRYFV